MPFKIIGGIIGAIRKTVEVVSIGAQQAAQAAVDVWGAAKESVRETTIESFKKVEGVTQATVGRVSEYVGARQWIEEYIEPSPFAPVEEQLWTIAEAVGDMTGKDVIEFWEKSQDIRNLGKDELIMSDLFTTTTDKLNTRFRGVFWMRYQDAETGEWIERAVYGGTNVKMTKGDMESMLGERFEVGEYPDIGYIESIDLIGMEMV